MNEEIHCITNEGKMAKYEWKMKTLNFFEIYAVHIKN